MINTLSLLGLVVIVADGGTVPPLSFDDTCGQLDQDQIRRVLAVELRASRETTDEPTLRVRCDEHSAVVGFDAPLAATRTLVLPEARASRSRELALAIAELVEAERERRRLTPPPSIAPVADAVKPAVPASNMRQRTWAFDVAAHLRTQWTAAPWLYGASLSVARRWGHASLAIRFGGLFGDEDLQSARARLRSGAIGTEVRWHSGGRWAPLVAGGVEIGLAQFSGTPRIPGDRAATFTAAHGGPTARVGLDLWRTRAVAMELRLCAGWWLFGLEGVTAAGERLRFRGPWTGIEWGVVWGR